MPQLQLPIFPAGALRTPQPTARPLPIPPAPYYAHLFFIHSPTSSPNSFLEQMVSSDAYDETVTLARREKALVFLPVRFDLLGAGDVGDVVPAPLVHREIARLVLTLQGGVHEQDIIEPKHGVLLLAVLTRQ